MSLKIQSDNMKKMFIFIALAIFLLYVPITQGQIQWLNNVSILEDVFTRTDNPNVNYGNFNTGNWVELNGAIPRYRRAYFKWNISSLGGRTDISYAEMCGQIVGSIKDADSDYLNVGFYGIDNISWDELSVTWNNQPCLKDYFAPAGNCSITPDDEINQTMANWGGIECWDITDSLITALENGWNNLSLSMSASWRSGVADGIALASRERDNNNLILNVTYPEYHNLTLGVFSADETEPNGTTCYKNIFNNTEIEFANTTIGDDENATEYIENCCYYQGTDYGCWFYELDGIPSGTYYLNISKTGYRPFNVELEFTDHMGYNAFLKKYDKADFYLTIENSSYPIESGKATLYDSSDNSIYEGETYLQTNPQYFADGLAYWQQIPLGSYYVVVEAPRHRRKTTPTLAISEDFNYSITLSETPYDISLSCSHLEAVTTDMVNCSIMFTGFVAPFNNIWIYVETQDGDQSLIQRHTSLNPYNVSLYVDKYMEDGENKIWVQYRDHVSNEWHVVVTDITDISEIETPFVDITGYNEQLGFIGAVLSPFSILFMALIGLSAILEQRIRSQGAVFFGCMIVGSMGLTYLGVFPAWIGIITIIFSAFILSKFILKVF